jgi:hypothetical protein
MDEHALLVIMAVFVTVAAVALLIQAGFLFGIYKAAKAMQENSARVLPKVESLVSTSQGAVEDGRRHLTEITTKAHGILDTAQRQMETVDSFLTDAAGRARTQMERAELFLDDTMTRAQQTVSMVHSSVITPVKQINSVATGIRAALFYLMRRNQPSPDRATVDEEMFI